LSEDASALDEKAKSALKLGLFSYPVLQAADILVHRYVFFAALILVLTLPSCSQPCSATHVPVGDDQRQHLEFARECATNFNHAFGQHLILPETILCSYIPIKPRISTSPADIAAAAPARRVMSLQQPTQKMSKSHADPRSRILLTDTPEEITKKVRAALTDSTFDQVSYEPDTRPGVSNLLEILSIFDKDGKSPATLAEELSSASATLKELKAKTADAVVSGLGGIRERYLEVLSRDGGKYMDYVENAGAEKARAHAGQTMDIVRSAVGL
jgi:tryptophanyl-tRNA synthetase